MSDLKVSAPPVSRGGLRVQAQRLRSVVGLANRPLVPVAELLENGILDLIAPGFEWDVVEHKLLRSEHGLTLIQEKLILIREDVYDRAVEGHGRDRLTIVHELAHATLHSGVALARQQPGVTIPRYRCPEWQANCFAGEFLVDYRQFEDGMDADDIAQEFGVSNDAADFQLRCFAREGLVDVRHGTVVKRKTREPARPSGDTNRILR